MHDEEYLTTEETLSSIRIVSDELTTTIENLVELVNIQVSNNIESQNVNSKLNLIHLCFIVFF